MSDKYWKNSPAGTAFLSTFGCRQKTCGTMFAGILALGFALGADAAQHFHAKGEGPSEHTRKLQQSLRASLPFEDTIDFEESRRGFIAAPDSRQILDSAGNVVWDLGSYEFLLSGESFDSIHPSLQRIATLNMNFGLYEVVPDFIYQVRGFDLANLTLIRGDTGWILFDVMLTRETAEAALALANEHLGQLPVKAIVYSHSHIDHFGGVLGVTSIEAVNTGDVAI
ncbi:MAG: MBL fold metallo-hydrolase, partial [Haliea sp.]